MDGVDKVRAALDRVLGWVVIAVVLLLVLDVCWGVITRYILGEQAKWTEELARFLLIWVALLGGALAFGRGGHLGVDFFVSKLHPDAQRLMQAVGVLLTMFFAGAILVAGGSTLMHDMLVVEQRTPALGWMMGYVYLALPISGVAVLLYACLDAWILVKGRANEAVER